MSKRKSGRPLHRDPPARCLRDTLGESGDEDLSVDVRHYIAVESTATDQPLELNAHEARKLDRALLKAADRLDGQR